MNDTLSIPDPATQLAEVRSIIEGRTFMHSCESTLLAIRLVIFPAPAEIVPPKLSPRGWPELYAADPPGDAWERHDDPEHD
ncbi:hypothetical protein [Kribbella catacumbae]|uniref:hypothetical protein n=1 Tax=Kribbella catacumbae TaxID=460086 RepID=UPI00035CD12F|nr:hypothetical protein [Kribbella catacumbae]